MYSLRSILPGPAHQADTAATRYLEAAVRLTAVASLPVGWAIGEPHRQRGRLILRATAPEGDGIEVSCDTTEGLWRVMAERLATLGEGQPIRWTPGDAHPALDMAGPGAPTQAGDRMDPAPVPRADGTHDVDPDVAIQQKEVPAVNGVRPSATMAQGASQPCDPSGAMQPPSSWPAGVYRQTLTGRTKEACLRQLLDGCDSHIISVRHRGDHVIVDVYWWVLDRAENGQWAAGLPPTDERQGTSPR